MELWYDRDGVAFSRDEVNIDLSQQYSQAVNGDQAKCPYGAHSG